MENYDEQIHKKYIEKIDGVEITAPFLDNYFEIHDTEMLNKIERDIVFLLTTKLKLKPWYITELHNGEEHFKQIHKFLFERIYPWAGNYRKVDISMDDEYRINELTGEVSYNIVEFEKHEYVSRLMKDLFEEISDMNYLQGQSGKNLANKLAYISNELNRIHPFRDGNGRVKRFFIEELAQNAGFSVLHNLDDASLILNAEKQAFRGEPYMLSYYYAKNLTPIN